MFFSSHKINVPIMGCSRYGVYKNDYLFHLVGILYILPLQCTYHLFFAFQVKYCSISPSWHQFFIPTSIPTHCVPRDVDLYPTHLRIATSHSNLNPTSIPSNINIAPPPPPFHPPSTHYKRTRASDHSLSNRVAPSRPLPRPQHLQTLVPGYPARRHLSLPNLPPLPTPTSDGS